jgi:1-acyl-sn-glycerol-3-phosphate acyltransferase
MSDGLPLFKKPWFEWFAWYSKGYLAKHFRALRLLKTGRPVVDSAEPLIVYMNHASWWDPIVGLLIAKELWPGRTHYGAMDREALQSYKFFENVGFFGVERGSPRGAAQFLKTAKAITGTPATALWMTPQGRFADARERPPELMSGLPQVLTKLEAGTVQPIAIEYTFWDERLPEVLVSLGPTCRVADLPRDREACQHRLSELLVQAQDELQVAAMQRDATLFDSLIEGRQGMSNVYGLWRSFKRGLSSR